MAIPKIYLFAHPDYVRKLTQVNLSVDDDRITPAIILAQDKHLQPYLGTRLYNRMLAILAGGTPNDHETYLLDTHCRRVVVWWTLVELLPDLHTFIDGAGLLTRAVEGATNSEREVLNYYVERARRNASFYTTRMIEYLQYNQEKHPEYSVSVEDEMPAEREAYFQNGMTISGTTSLRDKRDLYNAIFPLSYGGN